MSSALLTKIRPPMGAPVLSTGKPAVETSSRLKPGKEDMSTLKPALLETAAL